MNATAIAASRDKPGASGGIGWQRAGEAFSAARHLELALVQLAETEHRLALSDVRVKAAEHRADLLAAELTTVRQRIVRLAKGAARVRFLANHDRLTGLPNRSLLVDRLKQATAQAARQDKQVTLLFLDMDGFKGINDTYGHGTGDQLLQQVAERIASCIRGGDTASRCGGDEFVIMLPNTDALAGSAVASKIRVSLAEPFLIDGATVRMTASIGVAVYPADARHYAQLLRQADIAMYLDKARRPTIVNAR
jgi:diguanylate cyclase (GGDEF)-like protein